MSEIQELKDQLKEFKIENIEKLYLELLKTESEVKFVSPMSDCVLKTICFVGNEFVKNIMFQLFGYLLQVNLSDYELTMNYLPVMTLESIQNECDIRFIRKDKKSHILVEINQFKRGELTRNKNHSEAYKLAGETYSHTKECDVYTYPIDVKLLNLNNYHCEFNKDISDLSFRLMDKESKIELMEFRIYHFYLPKYKKMCYDGTIKEEERFLGILNAKNYEELRYLIKDSIEGKAFYIMLRELGENPMFMKLYNKEAYEENVKIYLKEEALRDGRMEGLKLGRKEGRKENSIEIAKKMRKENLSINLI